MSSSTASSTPPAPAPSVLALYGPTASGKTALAGLLRERLDAEVVSADSAALYRGLGILTAAPAYPARLVGIVEPTEDVSLGAYQRLAHAAIDEIVAAGHTAIVVGGTGLYLRAALAALELPPPPAVGARARWETLYDERGAAAAHELLVERDPRAAVRIHANDRRRVVRALELAEAGSSLAPPHDRLWQTDVRHPTLLVALDLDAEALDRRIVARARAMAAAGAGEEARRAWSRPLSATARKVMGLEAFATLPEDEAVAALVAANRRLARYQRKWLRRLAADATLDAGRPTADLADAIVALGRPGERLPRQRG